MKTVQIINIDGTRGAGKTTQVYQLKQYFMKLGRAVDINQMQNNLESGLSVLNKTDEFLIKNPNGIVINEGSIARMIANDMSNNLPKDEIYDKYRKLLSKYEVMDHKYKNANVLLLLEDLAECNRRLKKQAELLKQSFGSTLFLEFTEVNILKLMKIFDNQTLVQNIKFESVYVKSTDSILKIRDRLIKLFD